MHACLESIWKIGCLSVRPSESCFEARLSECTGINTVYEANVNDKHDKQEKAENQGSKNPASGDWAIETGGSDRHPPVRPQPVNLPSGEAVEWSH